MTPRDFALWSFLAVIWASSFVAIGIAVTSFGPGAVVAGRMAVGALFLLGVLALRGGSLRLGARGWAIAALIGTTGNTVPFLLISSAQKQVDSGLAALLMGIAPVVTLTLAPLIHASETLTRWKITGAGFGIAGVLTLVGPEALAGLGGDLLPQLALIGAALCYAFTALLARRFPHPDALQMAAGSVLVSAVSMGLVTTALSGWGGAPSLRAVLAVLYLGIGPTAFAALVYFDLIGRIGAARLQQVNYVVPVLGTIFGIVLLGERPEMTTLLAVPLIVLAVWCVTRPDPKPAAVPRS